MADPQVLGQRPHGQFTDAVRRDIRGYLLEQFGTAMLVTQFSAVDRRAVLHLQEPTQYRKHSSTGNTAVPETQQYRKHSSTGYTVTWWRSDRLIVTAATTIPITTPMRVSATRATAASVPIGALKPMRSSAIGVTASDVSA